MSNVGKTSIDIEADSSQARRSFENFFKYVTTATKKIERVIKQADIMGDFAAQVENSLQRAEKAFDKLERRINAFNPNLNINDVEIDTSTVERGLRTLESQIQEFNPSITINSIDIDDSVLERKLRQLEQRLAAFNPEMNIRTPDLDTSAIESRISALERRVERVDIGGGIERRARSSLRRAEEPFNDFYDYLDTAARRMENSMRAFSPAETLDQEIQRMNNSLNRFNPEVQLERQMRSIAQSVAQPIMNLPQHLKPFHDALTRTRYELQTTALTSRQSLDEMATAAIRSQVSLNRMMSATSSGKAAAKAIQELGDTTKTTQLAILGLSRDGKVKVSTEEAQRQMASFNDHVERTKQRLEQLRDAGDMASYNEGMRQLERQMQQVDRAMRAAAQGGTAYTSMLDQLGIHTANAANQAAIAMERMRTGFMRSIDHMNAMKTQSQKMMDALGDTSSIQRLDRAFLQVGHRLEEMAKRGTAANIALRQLGPNASMKDLMDRVRLINTGLMRMQQLALVAGIAVAGFTAIMFKLATAGPSVDEVAQQQAELTNNFLEELKRREDAIYNFAGLFEKIEIKGFDKSTLMNNLQEQVNVMSQWVDNMKSLSARVPEDLKGELYKMGPEAAGQIAALNSMSDAELAKYVELWREKHSLARQGAMDELAKLKEETERKISELEKSLQPLTIATEKFKQAWLDALGPFIEIWGEIAAKILDAGTAIGNFIAKLNETNPEIVKLVGMFTFLFTTLVMLLSPMAIGIGKAEGMAAAFTLIWTTIKPVILGFLRVAGMASLVAGAIVLVGGSIMKMWEHSENFRNSITSAWENIQSVFGSLISSIAEDAQRLFDAFMKVINLLIGGSGSSTQSFWTSLGDAISKVIDLLSGMLMPVLSAVGSVISNAFSAVVDVFVAIFKAIEPVVVQIRNFISVIFEAFSALSSGGNSAAVWETVTNIFNFLVNIIRDVFVGAITLLGSAFSRHFSNVIAILTTVVQAFTFVIQKVREFTAAIISIFNGDIGAGVNILEKLGFSPSQIQTIIASVTQVKMVIRSFIDGVVQGFTQAYSFVKALFDFFAGNNQSGVDLLKQLGMSEDTIQSVVSIVDGIKAAFNSLWSFFSENILPIIKDIGSSVLEGLTGIVTGIVEIVSGIIQVFFGWLSGDVESWSQGLKGIFDGVVTIISSVFSTAFEIWKGIFQIQLEILAAIWGALLDWISPYIEAAIDYITTSWNSLVEDTKSILTGIGDFFVELWNQCMETTTSILGSIGTFFIDLWNSCVETTTSILSGIGTFFIDLWNQCVEVTVNTLNSVLNFLGEWAANILNFFAPAIGLIIAVASLAWEGLKATTEFIFNSIYEFIMFIWQMVYSAITSVVNLILPYITAAWDMISSVTSTVFNAISTFILAIWTSIYTYISEKISAAVQFITDGWNLISSVTSTVWNLVVSYISSTLSAIYSYISEKINAAVQFVSNQWNLVSSVTSTIWNYIVSDISRVLSSIYSYITEKISAAAQYLSDRWNMISSVTSNAWNQIKSYVSNALSAIYNYVSDKISAAYNYISDKWNSTLSTTSSIWNSIKSTISNAWNGIYNYVSDKVNAVKSYILDNWSSLSGSVTSVFNAVKKAIIDPIVEAYNKVVGIVKDIKAAFNFKIDIPKPNIPIPSFNFDKGDLLNGVMPSFGVKWHANGGFFDKASIIGIGEAGREAAVPLVGRRMDPFADAVFNRLAEKFNGSFTGSAPSSYDKEIDLTVNMTNLIDGREVAGVTYKHVTELQKHDEERIKQF
ncbi:hypothetical protein P4U07_27795 [Bacillus mycoides]|uniref:hypothetical protein n=1 Tax=Bacillus mycoides TaxID=1405 RepID=UPI002E1AF4A7|nr:hypothetical protein [Bacillus mycoides]